MIEANRAYALGDEEQLRGILEAWERSPEKAAKGKDLVTDMVRRLKREILVATNRLDALRPPD